MSQKLFVSFDGSDPDCYEGERLVNCLSKFLDCLDLDDAYVESVIEDIATFLANEPFDEDGRVKRKFSTTTWESAAWCYGYDSWEEAFYSEDNVV